MDFFPKAVYFLFMKSAYELAMERLNKSNPMAKLSAGQKSQIVELESKYAAKIAEREIFLKSELAKAQASRDYEEAAKIEKQLASDRKSLKAELEEKKDAVRGT
jgi:hypothetical protein